MSKIFIIIFLIIVFYIGFIAYSDFNEFAANIKNFKIEFLPIILATSFFSLVILGKRQQILLKELGIKIPFKDNLMIYFSGLSLIVTPGGAGEAIKSYYLKKKLGHNIAKTLPLVFVEKFSDLIAVTSIISLALFFIQKNEIFVIISIIIGIIILVYGALRIRSFFNSIINVLKKIRRLDRFLQSLTESYDGLHSMTSRKILFKSWLISVVAWIIEAVSIYFVFLAFDVDLGIILTTMIMYSSVLVGALSFLPGGIGVTEVSAMKLLTQEGLELSLSTSIIIMMRITSIWFATIIGFITTKFVISKYPKSEK